MSAGRVFWTRFIPSCLAVWGLLAGVSPSVRAQALRDPTVAPAGAVGSTPTGAAVTSKGEAKPLSVMVVDGRPFVMSGSRLYAQGDKLGQATVERISETQIWLREGKELRKINLYSGVQRQPHVAVKTEPRCGPGVAALPGSAASAVNGKGATKSGHKKSSSTAQIQDPVCKSATP